MLDVLVESKIECRIGISGRHDVPAGPAATDVVERIWLDWLVKDGQVSAGRLKLSDFYTNQLNPFLGTGPT